MTSGVLLALCSALVWGSGDFCGGRASTRLDAFQVLGLSALSGIVVLLGLMLATSERVSMDGSAGWALVAGLSSALGIVSLYRGLSVASPAVVAPTAAVVAALVPVLFGLIAEGAPAPTRIAGFALALVGIALVARAGSATGGSRRGLKFGALAGVGFGGFLVLIAQVPTAAVYVPLVIARGVMFALAVAVLAGRRIAFPRLLASPVGLLAGVLDAGGTALYLLARQHVRLDVAAVLSSFYPAATVILARAVTGEPVTGTQWAGALVCVAAIGLIAA
jgi:drug/metabolite transporter (DMT)-like permease